jgi:ribosomal protein S18 acetylase RimI-like enzyme
VTHPERVTIRRATATDGDSISSCIAESFAEFKEFYTASAFADTVPTPAQVLERMRHMSVYVATDSAEDVLGTLAVSIHEPHAHLRGMAVRPQSRGGDIARRLLLAVEQDLMQAGCVKITLGTTLILVRAIRFYRNHGFTPSGLISDYFGMDLHEFEKTLR